MILRTHLISLAATAITFGALPYCLPSLILMISWLAWFCVYLGVTLLNCLSLELAEERHLPANEPLLPKPLQFVALSEKSCLRMGCESAAASNSNYCGRHWPRDDVK